MPRELFYFTPLEMENMLVQDLDQRRRQRAAMEQRFTEIDAQRLAALSSYYPNLSPGLLTGAALAGLEPTDAQMTSLAIDQTGRDVDLWQSQRNEATDEGFISAVGRVFKGVTRGIFLGFDYLWEEGIQRPIRTMVETSRGADWFDAYREAGPSMLNLALRERSAGRPVNLGSGYFPGGDLGKDTQQRLQSGATFDQAIQNPEQQALGLPIQQQQQQMRERIKIRSKGGQEVSVTPGRLLAINFSEPNTLPFNMVSGATDFAANIFLDPTNLLFAGVGKARKAAQVLQPATEAVVAGGRRPGFLSRTWDEYLQSGSGQDVVNWGAQEQDFATVWGLLRGTNTPAAGLSRVAKNITDTNDPTEVLGILRSAGNDGVLAPRTLTPTTLTGRALGYDGSLVSRGAGALVGGKVGALGGFKVGLRHSLDGTWFGKMGANVGAKSLNIYDMDQSVEDFGAWLKVAGFKQDRMSHYMSELAGASQMNPDGVLQASMGDAFKVVRDAVAEWGDELKKLGLPEPVAKGVTRLFDSHDDMKKYWINAGRKNEWFNGAKVEMMVDGELRTLPSAHMFSEFLEQAIPLVDVRKVRKAAHKANIERFRDVSGVRLGKAIDDWDEIGPNLMERLMDGYMQRIWKPAVLLRAAWPIRVIGEEQIRMAASGLDSMFRHPAQWLAWTIGGKRGGDVFGNAFEASVRYQGAMSRKAGAAGFIGPRNTKRAPLTDEFIMQTRGEGRHVEGAWRQINLMATDELMPLVIRNGVDGTMDELKESFMTGDLAELRFRLMRDGDRWGTMDLRAQAEGYIDSLWARANGSTGGRYYVRHEHPNAFREGALDPMTGEKYTDEMLAALQKDTGVWRDDLGNIVPWEQIPNPDGSLRTRPPPLDTGMGDPDAVRFLREDQIAEEGVAVQVEILMEDLDLENFANLDVLVADLDEALNALARSAVGPNPDPTDANFIDNAFEGFTSDVLDAAIEGESFEGPMARLNTAMERYFGSASDEVTDALVAALDAAPIKEFAPYLEALKMSRLKTGEFADSFATVNKIGRLQPLPMPNMADGVHRLPSDSSDLVGNLHHHLREGASPDIPLRGLDNEATVVSVYQGKMHGLLRLEYDDTGKLADVGLFQHSGDPAAPGAKQMIAAALEAGDVKLEEIVEMMLLNSNGSQITFDQWLRYAAAKTGLNTEGVDTIDDLVTLIRQNPDQFRAMNPYRPGDTTQVSRMGAEATSSGMRMSARSPEQLARHGLPPQASAANIPQHRPQYVIAKDGNQEMLAGIADGKLRDMDLLDADTNKKVKELIRMIGDNYADSLPQYTHVAKHADKTLTNQWDQAVDGLFGLLMSIPTNKLSRSPAFKQFYWQRIGKLFPYATNEVKEQILHAARDAGLGRGTLKGWLSVLLGGQADASLSKLDQMAGPGFKLGKLIGEPMEGITSLSHIDEIAKAAALHETKGLLYDLSRKHNFFDMTRNIFPFGEAWWEIISTWSRIITENPEVLRRLQQGVSGARNSGFFYDDPTTDEEVFNFPGAGAISKWMFGGEEGVTGDVTAQFTGRVQGVNLMLGSYMPGVGPLVQIPASMTGWMDDPDNKWAKEMLLPFGQPEIDGLGDVLETMIAPTWWDKFMTAMGNPTGDNERLYDNTVIDVYKALLMEGGDDSSPEASSKLLDRAKILARRIYRFRAASAYIGPTGASVRFDVRDKKGEVWAFQSLATVYAEMLEANDYDHNIAFEMFSQRFGLDPSSLYTAKTRPIFKRSVTEGGAEFEARNQELLGRLPLTFYYARPDDPDEEFDYAAYLKQLEEGTRAALSPEEWTRERNDFVGRIAYERARRAFDRRGGEETEIVLRNYRTELAHQYPGYDQPTPGLDQRATRDMLIDEFYSWEDIPSLAATPMGEGLAAYLGFRDQVIAEGIRLGLTPTGFRSAKRTRYLRDWLRTVANSLQGYYPEFTPMWDQIFAREIEETEPPLTFMGEDFSG